MEWGHDPDAFDLLIMEAHKGRHALPNEQFDSARKTLLGQLIPLGSHVVHAFKLRGSHVYDVAISEHGKVAIVYGFQGDAKTLAVWDGIDEDGFPRGVRIIKRWTSRVVYIEHLHFPKGSEEPAYVVTDESAERAVVTVCLPGYHHDYVCETNHVASLLFHFDTRPIPLITTAFDTVMWGPFKHWRDAEWNYDGVAIEVIGGAPQAVVVEYRVLSGEHYVDAKVEVTDTWTSERYKMIQGNSFAMRRIPPSVEWWAGAPREPQPSFIAWIDRTEESRGGWHLVFPQGTVELWDDPRVKAMCLADGRILYLDEIPGDPIRVAFHEPLTNWESDGRCTTPVLQVAAVESTWSDRLAVLATNHAWGEQVGPVPQLRFYDHQGDGDDAPVDLPGAKHMMVVGGHILTDPVRNGLRVLHWEHFDKIHKATEDGDIPLYGPMDRLVPVSGGYLMTWVFVNGTFYVIRYALPTVEKD